MDRGEVTISYSDLIYSLLPDRYCRIYSDPSSSSIRPLSLVFMSHFSWTWFGKILISTSTSTQADLPIQNSDFDLPSNLGFYVVYLKSSVLGPLLFTGTLYNSSWLCHLEELGSSTTFMLMIPNCTFLSLLQLLNFFTMKCSPILSSDILSWMNSNKLLLESGSKTEFLLIGTKLTTAQIFSTHNSISTGQ